MSLYTVLLLFSSDCLCTLREATAMMGRVRLTRSSTSTAYWGRVRGLGMVEGGREGGREPPTLGCLHATGPSWARVVGRRVENMKEEPSSSRVGGVSPASKDLSRKLTVTSSSVVARCTLSWTTFWGLAETGLGERRDERNS